MACEACGAGTGHFYDCPIGGMQTVAPAAAPQVPLDAPSDGGVELERALLFALPVVLLGAWLINLTGVGAMLTRIVFAMWLHELGHATTGWLCGSFAIPAPWVTWGGHERSVFFVLVEFGALGFWAWRRRDHVKFVAPLAVLLLIGLVLPAKTMDALVTFDGDGGALVFGTLLMATVFLPPSARLAKGGLRWGFLVIGAGAFANVLLAWWRAWRDPAEIPFGAIEGVGLSDPSRLVDLYGWSEHRVVMSYLVLGTVCLLVLATAWAWRVVTMISDRRR